MGSWGFLCVLFSGGFGSVDESAEALFRAAMTVFFLFCLFFLSPKPYLSFYYEISVCYKVKLSVLDQATVPSFAYGFRVLRVLTNHVLPPQ